MRLSESKLPYDVVFVLNQYRGAMARAIEEAGGVVNEFVGDGIMAMCGLDGRVGTMYAPTFISQTIRANPAQAPISTTVPRSARADRVLLQFG